VIYIDGNVIEIKTKTLTARVEGGVLTDLKSLRGESFIDAAKSGVDGAIQLIYSKTDSADLSKRCETYVQKLSDNSAYVCIDGWYGEGVIKVEEDPETGDLLITPAVTTRREGLRAVRYMIKGIREDLEAVVPIYQGAKLKLDDPLLKGVYRWPFEWEAGLVILQGKETGFWIHTQDDRYRYKTLHIGAGDELYSLGFDTEAYGPIDHNKSAGGITWRINVYEGDWHVPAGRYSAWLFDAYNLSRAGELRPEWVSKLGLAVAWCPCDTEILDALAKKSDPSRIMMHLNDWRTDPYDTFYPRYMETEKAAVFIKKALSMGFHPMPHMNSNHIDPLHADYYRVQGFELRDFETKKIFGWVWDPDFVWYDVPNGATVYNKKRLQGSMIAIHPGLAKWRSILTQNIKAVVDRLGVDFVFTDQTLITFNADNALVENMTSTEGINLLIHQVAAINNGIAVCGEGLNEITFQGQSVSMTHLFKSVHVNADGLERAGGCNLNNHIFRGLCRPFGYSNLDGKTEESRLRMKIYQDHDWIPTITISSADDILNPNPVIKAMLDM